MHGHVNARESVIYGCLWFPSSPFKLQLSLAIMASCSHVILLKLHKCASSELARSRQPSGRNSPCNQCLPLFILKVASPMSPKQLVQAFLCQSRQKGPVFLRLVHTVSTPLTWSQDPLFLSRSQGPGPVKHVFVGHSESFFGDLHSHGLQFRSLQCF